MVPAINRETQPSNHGSRARAVRAGKDPEPVAMARRSKGDWGGVGEGECWGKPAEWVDYSTKINNETVGIAIFSHPQGFRHPTHWHVRGYCLFAANPFGLHDFYNDKTKDGSYTLGEGKSLYLRYRVLIHLGTAKEANIAQEYNTFVRDVKY